MKVSFAVACLISNTSAVKLRTPSESLVQFLDSNAVQVEQDPAAGAFAKSVQTLEHCPDFNERFTLKDG